jgi:PAT family beta-lactamase induction signal transducer AmpG
LVTDTLQRRVGLLVRMQSHDGATRNAKGQARFGTSCLMNLLAHRQGRKVLFFSLYLSEGAPIGFLWWALPVRLRSAGLDVETITGLTSVLVFPWVLKFLWSPLIDAGRTSRWTRRSWILAAQGCMGASLIPLLFWDPVQQFTWMVPLLIFHAFIAATQDAAIDALAVSSVPRSEQGTVNSWMQVGLLLGRSALGGGALLLEDYIGARGVVLLLIGVIWSSSLLLLGSREPTTAQEYQGSVAGRWAMLIPLLRGAFRKRETLIGLLFTLVAGAGFEGVGALAGVFMIDRGFQLADVGRFFAVSAVGGMVVGSLAGGYAADTLGKQRTVSIAMMLVAAAIFGLSACDVLVSPSSMSLIIALLTLLYVFIGLFTASSYALLMGISDSRVGATQFSAFMAGTNACEAWAAFAGGRAVPILGYAGAFAALAVISLAILPWVRFISPHEYEQGTSGE